MKTYGLIGRNLSHSFSHKYFQKKFCKEQLSDCQYLNFEIEDISILRDIVKRNNLNGVNITIPFKEKVIPFLDKLSKDASDIGAVNTIEIKGEKFIGHNTDFFGFAQSFIPLLKERRNALILGNGGASKCVQFVLKRNNIDFIIASRNSDFTFKDITEETIQKHSIIINTTPLGMYPKTNRFPNLPYNAINSKHLVYDLVYNPEQSTFLRKAKAKNAKIKNGKQMLCLQAEKSWKIWNLNINL
jgi:shikimate dehydrogenase